MLSSDSPSSSSALFSIPDSAVVRLSAKQEKKSSSHPAQADIGGGAGGAQQVEDPASRPSESAEADTHSELSAKVGPQELPSSTIATASYQPLNV